MRSPGYCVGFRGILNHNRRSQANASRPYLPVRCETFEQKRWKTEVAGFYGLLGGTEFQITKTVFPRSNV